MGADNHALSPLLQFGRLFPIIPPGFRNAARKARLDRRPAENVPKREPVRGLVPVRNPIAPAPDDPVERPAGGDQTRTSIGCDDPLDKGVDNGGSDTSQILRSLQFGGLRGKIAPQRIARRAGKSEPLDDEIEVEIILPLAILHRIDNAQARLNAEGTEILDERHVMRLERRLVNQEFYAEALALRGHTLALPCEKAGLLPQRRFLAHKRAI